MGLSYDELFPGRFLKSGQFKGMDVTMTIARIRLEDLEGDGGVKTKPIVTFRETKKELVLNRTNAEAFKAMWGKETDTWVGKRVTLWPAPYVDNTTGEKTTAIRVRGSPDIGGEVTFSLKLQKKKPVQVRLAKTSGMNGVYKDPAPAATPAPPPPSQPTPISDAEKAAILAQENAQGGDLFS